MGPDCIIGRERWGLDVDLCCAVLKCSVMSDLCDPVDYNPPGSCPWASPILEWVVIPSSRGSSPSGD